MLKISVLVASALIVLPLAAQIRTHSTDRIVRAVDDRITVTRSGDIHPMARPQFDEGTASLVTRMDRMVLVLSPSAAQQDGLEQFLAAQQDPQAPEYQQWLSPEEFGARFGVSTNDVNQVVSWLQSYGFSVEPVDPAHTSIVFSGSASQVDAAFHTSIHNYAINGQRHYANATAPRIPAALAGVVAGIVSLHNFESKPQHVRAEYTSGSSHSITPADFATIYDIAPVYNGGTDGTGQSIAIVGRTNINVSDVQTFRSTFGLPANNPTVVLNGPNPGIVSSGEEGEATLDVEWSGAVAKKANILFVVSGSTSSSDGVTLSAQYIVNHNLAPVMSLSFGNCEAALGKAGNQFWNALWQQAAAQGISVLVSSGDSGSAGCDDPSATKASNGRGVNGLCSSPYSTCVGGTQFNDATNASLYWSSTNSSSYGSALSYIPEMTWNESASITGGSGLWSTGGGASSVYTKPVWQAGAGVPSDGWRDVPDVSLNAAMHDAALMYMSGYFYTVGGTSVAAPSFAGIMSLTAQRAGQRLGCVNPVLYTLASKQSSGGLSVFHDVSAGSNSVPNVNGYTAGAGYDLATGLGSVDVANLLSRWSDGSATPAPPSTPSFQMSVTPTTASVRAGSSVTASIQIAKTGAFNSAVSLSVSGLPSWLTASFSPASIAPTATSSVLTLTANAQAPSTITSITVTAVGGGITRTTTLALTSASACTFSLDHAAASAGAAAGTYSDNVVAGSGCQWTAVSNSPWISVTSGTTGAGNGVVNFSVAPNTATTQRSGSLTIAGLTLAITQAAAPQTSLGASSANFSSPAASTGSVAVTAPANVTWTATSNANWITITSGASATGSKTVTFSVAANTSAARSGTLTIAGQTFTVSQAGAACTYSLGNGTTKTTSTGFSLSIPVVAPASCGWTAVSNATWLSVTSGASGTGNGTVLVNVAATPNAASKTGTLTIAGLTVTITIGK